MEAASGNSCHETDDEFILQALLKHEESVENEEYGAVFLHAMQTGSYQVTVTTLISAERTV